MLKFSADLKINRPVDKVFAWLTNADSHVLMKTASCGPNAMDRVFIKF